MATRELDSTYARGKDLLSQAAFDSIDGSVRAGMQRDVLAVIRQRNGATTDEIEQVLDGRHQSVSPRVIELERAGLIKRSGDRRKTRSGRMANVYVEARS